MEGEADNDNADAVYGLSGEASVNVRRDRPLHNRSTGSLAGRCWLNMRCMNMLIMFEAAASMLEKGAVPCPGTVLYAAVGGELKTLWCVLRAGMVLATLSYSSTFTLHSTAWASS